MLLKFHLNVCVRRCRSLLSNSIRGVIFDMATNIALSAFNLFLCFVFTRVIVENADSHR